ncbi:MAG: hypothetical protein QW137_09930, partial [Candidatus Caldarchaeum sp.]
KHQKPAGILTTPPKHPSYFSPDGRTFRWRDVLRREVLPPVGESLRRPRPPGRAMSPVDMVEGPASGVEEEPAPGLKLSVLTQGAWAGLDAASPRQGLGVRRIGGSGRDV